MNRPALPIAAVLIFTAAGATLRAQTQAPQPPQSTMAPAPATSTTQASSPSPAAPQATPKKVWTNEEMSSLDPHSGVSTVRNANGNSAKPETKPRTITKGHDAKWYQDRIARLRAKIPPIDKQIAELQATLDGKPTGDGKQSSRPRVVKVDNWATQLANLKKQRDDTLAQISALQDQARHNGVAPNALP